ncbi:hypothetical protein HYH03_010382 [Edaphochlamys debaryana]|uniref:Lipoxygenase domain-containing protein n=1 Tax=Edaphochlamys debaryana TaxID=47281 RepID=A0A836BW75_9CHLO|nr:hypothetical protein HYH03_010382 [Edaphochlamys debaryana]|eukprot:KAG2491170.1 hypothetical protein HYH03_010382 [Edaphochlamys debaryana]
MGYTQSTEAATSAAPLRVQQNAASSSSDSGSAGGNGASKVKVWECTITSGAPLKRDTGTGIQIVIVDRVSETRSDPVSIDTWRPPVVNPNTDGTSGWRRSGPITLPASISEPGAVLIRTDREKDGHATVEFIGTIKLVSAKHVYVLTPNSWVSSDQGWRTCFIGEAFLPKDTPRSLLDDRKDELKQLQAGYLFRSPYLQGNPTTRMEERKPADRIYWYQTYDDLSAGSEHRPRLGGSKELPYPRRLATNRGTQPNSDREKPPAKGEKMWLPFDEQFSYHKSVDFQGATLEALPAAAAGLARAGLGRRTFNSFDDVLRMFYDDSRAPAELNPSSATKAAGWDFSLDDAEADSINRSILADRKGPAGAPGFADDDDDIDDVTAARGARAAADGHGLLPEPGVLGAVLDRVKNKGINDLLRFPVPKVLDGRRDAWDSDTEMGRQALAGFNPVTLTALRELPEKLGSAIRSEHVNDDLQGATLESLVADAQAGGKPRLFWQDYWALSAYWGEAGKDQNQPGKIVQHAGRALYYLRKDVEKGDKDAGLVPIAIELAHPNTAKELGLKPSEGVVYSRSHLRTGDAWVVWELAKAVFRSLDTSVHQLDSHFTRTHACLEPFLIAMRRNISYMHPVFKLMLPHFRYTLNINRNARSSLINAGGIIEKTFSAGEYAMRLAAKLYGATWTFAGQALPEDLKRRGMLGPDGNPWLQYPYAQDGMRIWDELEKYFDSYLQLYYKSDADVTGDEELQAWWAEVKAEGHPDPVKVCGRTEAEVWGFEGPIPSIDKLVHVLVTIAYMASAHHAAVNFGQYDFSSLILNNSSLIRRHMPVEGTAAWEELVGARGNAQEKVYMTYLADPFSAVQVMATIKLLSSHARDEQTLDELNEYLVDKPAVEANARFAAAMKDAEATFEMRNADPEMWARYGLVPPGPDTESPLPYTLLMPSSGSGVTMRGVPYSVSI